MAPRKDLILFCDLETTGSNPDIDEVIEVGISVWTWPKWEEVFAKAYVVTPTESGFERIASKDVVREMHSINGLHDDIANKVGFLSPDDADAQIDNDLLMFGTRNSSHIPLAGSGVLHFDRRFIKKFLPRFDVRLSHWAYDVGVMRRMFELAGLETAPSGDLKTHRALDDARVHASEFIWYYNKIGKIWQYEKLQNS